MHLRLCLARSSSGLWKFGFVGARLLEGPDWSLTRPAAEPVTKCACRAWCSHLRKAPPWPTFWCIRTTHFFEESQLQFDRQSAMCRPVSKTKLFHRTHRRMRKRHQRHRVCHSKPPHGNFKWSGMLFFTLQTFAIGEDGPCHLTVRILKGKRWSALCTPNFYDVQCKPAKRRSPWRKPQEWGKPRRISQSAS